MLQHGFQRNQSYITKMESIVGANGQRTREVVKEICDIWRKRSPMFVTIPEDENLTFKQAAILLRLPHKFVHFDPDKDEPSKKEVEKRYE